MGTDDIDDLGPGPDLADFYDEPDRNGDDVVPDGTPAVVVETLKAMCRSPVVAQRVLETAGEKLLRRHKDRTASVTSQKWARKFEPQNIDSTLKWLGKIRDKVLTQYHQESVYGHEHFTKMPGYLRRYLPGPDGFLIDDPEMVTPSIGSPAYLEATPPAIIRWVYEVWARNRNVDDDGADLDEDIQPRVWDITAGSGTVSDLLEGILGCEVVATDLSIGYSRVRLADAREVDSLPWHRDVTGGFGKPDIILSNPDMVFIDPPSMGYPAHSAVYHGSRPSLDLASLPPTDWAETVADITIRAVNALAPGGLVSLLVRHGYRIGSKVEGDDDLLDGVKAGLGPSVQVIHEHKVQYRRTRQQIHLGKSRVPSTHLLLTQVTS